MARNARLELEQKTGKPVISPLNAKIGIPLNLPEKMRMMNKTLTHTNATTSERKADCTEYNKK